MRRNEKISVKNWAEEVILEVRVRLGPVKYIKYF
jgi:hypothetical protein